MKKFLTWFLGILVVLNVLIYVTGITHVYKGIVNTYFKGKLSADIDEYQIFDNREVQANNYQAWSLGKDYNLKQLTEKCLTTLEEYQTIAFLIIHDDSIRHEQYWEGYSGSSHTNAFSMAKSIVSILTGIAIEEGKIESVDQKVGDLIDGYSEGLASELTIKHLLTMSSGINFDESYLSPFAFPAYAYFGSDLKRLVAKYEVTEQPGEVFEYLSGNTQLLSFILEKKTGMKVADYASEKLWNPLGAKHSAYWSLDYENGYEKAYCCFNSNARDFARIGQLYLKNGNWKGRQIVSEDYVQRSIVPANLVEKDDGSELKRYGYSWWMTDYKGYHIYLAEGLKGQYVAVIPNKNAVFVRLGRNKSKAKINRLPADLFTYIDYVLEAY